LNSLTYCLVAKSRKSIHSVDLFDLRKVLISQDSIKNKAKNSLKTFGFEITIITMSKKRFDLVTTSCKDFENMRAALESIILMKDILHELKKAINVISK